MNHTGEVVSNGSRVVGERGKEGRERRVIKGGRAGGDITEVVAGMDDIDVLDARKHRSASTSSSRKDQDARMTKKKNHPGKEVKKGSKEWILRKKEQMERKGKVVKATSKYTGRKRGPRF